MMIQFPRSKLEIWMLGQRIWWINYAAANSAIETSITAKPPELIWQQIIPLLMYTCLFVKTKSMKGPSNCFSKFGQIGFLAVCNTRYAMNDVFRTNHNLTWIWFWHLFKKFFLQLLTDGITNKLVKCTYNINEVVLVRVYGRKTDLLIDRTAETR